jgi:hypothetical protein
MATAAARAAASVATSVGHANGAPSSFVASDRPARMSASSSSGIARPGRLARAALRSGRTKGRASCPSTASAGSRGGRSTRSTRAAPCSARARELEEAKVGVGTVDNSFEPAHWRVAEEGADQQEDEPKQKTPEGREIPIPKREEFFGNLKEVSKPDRTRRPAIPPGTRQAHGARSSRR